MKTLLLFYCLFFLLFDQVNATESQDTTKITIHFKNQPLDSALCQLERQSGHSFIYQDKITGTSSKVNRKFKNKPLSQILDVLLARTNNNYMIIGNIVIIYKITIYSSEITQNQKHVPFLITGKVVDEYGGGLRAVVSAKENHRVYFDWRAFKTRVLTDNDGIFVISTDNPNAQLIVSYPAYYPQIVHIKNAALIELKPDSIMTNTVFTIGQTKHVDTKINSAESQDTMSITIHLKNLPLDSALVQLERQSGLSLVRRAKLVDIALPEVDTTESQDRTSITIHLKNLPLDSALVQLERQSRHAFIYQDKITGTSFHVNQEFENKPLSQILDTLLAKTENSYVIIGGEQVIIYKIKTCAENITRNQRTVLFLIEGKVINEKGKSVRRACVAIKKERRVFLKDRDYKPYVRTNVNGTFVISVDNPDTELIVYVDMCYPQIVHIKDAALIKLKAYEFDENKIW